MTTRPTQSDDGGRGSTRPMDAPEQLVGRVLEGRYRLDEVLNTGGMGIVFSATQLNVDRRVAVKILKPTLSRNPSLMERFQLEVEVVAQISHPNVVRLLDTGRDGSGLTYLVMEFVEGKTLRECLRHEELRLDELLEVFAQICTALVEIHAQQIVHRDLKFDNIMIQRMRDGRIHVKLLDFGVAKLLTSDQNLTEGGQVAGTPAIVAPELVDGADPTARSDLYSLGVVLFTTLVGRMPFRADNDLELMQAHASEPLPNLWELVGDRVPEEVIDLTCELLSKKPDRRPEDARMVRNRLETMAERFRHRHPDATAYRPPESAALEDSLPRIESISEIQPLEREGDRPETGLFERIAGRTLVVPMSVVGALSALLLVLIVVLMYLGYQQIFAEALGG